MQQLERLFDWNEWVVKCSMTKDENSFIEEMSFIVLDMGAGPLVDPMNLLT